MRRFSTWAFGIIATIFGGVAVYYLTQRQQETITAILGAAEAAQKFLHDLAEQTWFLVTASFLVGFAAGFLVKWLLQRLDGSRAKERKALGTEMARLGNYPAQIKFPFPTKEKAQIMSCFASAKKFGIWAPDGRAFPFQAARARSWITDYLSKVGQMLSDGNFREAKQYAKKRKVDFDSIA